MKKAEACCASWIDAVADVDPARELDEAELWLTRTVRIGIGCTLPLQLGHLVIVMVRFPWFARSVGPILFCDLAFTGFFLGWTWTRSFHDRWREGVFAWSSTLVVSAAIVGTITHQMTAFFLALVLMLFGTAAFAPWGMLWQSFFVLVCLGAAVAATEIAPQAADGFQLFRLLELSTAAFISLFLATLTERYRNSIKLRLQALVQNVEQLRAAERAVAAAREAAEASSRAKSDFLSSMSHEIRTPMNAILGMAEVLADSELSPDQRKYLSIMMNNGGALLDLINAILDLARVESGRLKLEETSFDLYELTERVAETLALRAHQKGLELIVDISPATPQTVIGDPLRVRQVLTNLLGNAIKFTAQGEIALEIRPEDDHGMIRFAVHDTGIGIPAEQIESIFSSYAQAESSTARKYGGSGLGLAIVKQLAELMGGRVAVESTVDCGSTFHLSARFRLPDGSATAATVVTRPPGNLKLLVVDPNATSRRTLAAMLAHLGAQCTVAADGDEALARLRDDRHGYDALLLDNQAMGLGGVEAARRIIAAGCGQITIIPMLTANDLSVKLPIFRGLGLITHLVKPIRRAELAGALQAVAEERTVARLEKPAAFAASGAALALGAAPDRETAPRLLSRPAVLSDFVGSLRILVADDSPDNRLLIEAFTRKTGCSLDQAADGAAALGKFMEHRYDIVLMDMHMPVMDGYMAVRRIREWEKLHGLRRTPIIALTASVLDGAVGKTLEVGCDSHVSKPVRREILIAAIRELVDAPAVRMSRPDDSVIAVAPA
ncbi:MAG TPA: response regulator [Candidatus Binataceae bacterium]|nr:response regulator [Candidatus Binataceae bacterium]